MNAWEPALLREAKTVTATGHAADRTKRFLSMIPWLWVLLLPWLTTSCVSTMTNYHGHKVFNPLYLFYLESSKRDLWQMPEHVLNALQLSEGSVVADIGAGGEVIAEMEAGGFRLVERFDFLPREYFLVFGLADDRALP